MKRPCIIASYGGSGSAFLTDVLKQIPNTLYSYEHVHGVPTSDFLGVPIFNRYTGHNEGPFSKSIELSRDAKVIVIYRNLAEAYQSQAGFKHFMHIWSDTDRMRDVFGHSQPTEEIFNQKWVEYRQKGQDILFLEDYLDRWRKYAELGKHDIAFVKYENLREEWKNLVSFLSISVGGHSELGEIEPHSKVVTKEASKIFGEVSKKLESWDPFELFPRRHNMIVEKGNEVVEDRKPLPGSSFTCIKLGAGASDAIGRLGVAFDAIRSNYDVEFILPEYSNYHSRALDFFELFGIKKAYCSSGNASDLRPELRLSLSECIYLILFDRDLISDGHHYIIEADIYDGDFRIEQLRKYGRFRRMFSDRFSYTPRSLPFSSDPQVVKATFHLRRQDICGLYLFLDDDTEQVPTDIRSDIHGRRLLHISRATRELERRLPRGANVEVIIVSDGFGEIRRRFSDYPHVLSRIDNLSNELYASVVSDELSIRVIDRIIGTESAETIKTLDAMYLSDIVLTASSSFPRLICEISGTHLVYLNLQSRDEEQ